MGLTDKISKIWREIKDAAHATGDLREAIKNNDIEAARLAISHATPASRIYEDPVIRIVSEYSKSDNRNGALLQAMREAVYENFDAKIPPRIDLFDEYPRNDGRTGYQNPLRIYGMAAYMDDTAKLQELNRNGIKPDDASNYGGLTENIVMGAARLGMYEAMKEVIRQGASIDKTFGWDEFPPLHAFSKPLFHAFHPGVTEALQEIDDERIRKAVNEALSQLSPPRKAYAVYGGPVPSPA